MSEPMRIPVEHYTVTPAVRMIIEFHDPFGTIMGTGEIVIDSQQYHAGFPDMSGDELLNVQTAQRVGKYVQANPPNPNLACWIRVRRAE